MAKQTSRSIGKVTERWGDLRYMSPDRAEFIRKLMVDNNLTEILELGFFHGKSSAYIASVLEEMGTGHLTTMDLNGAQNRQPNIETVLGELGLRNWVTPIYSARSFTWELHEFIQANPRPRFDLCYIDGAHTWDGTGFSFFLVDILLKPGGWVIFDDLDWSIADSPSASKKGFYPDYPEPERKVKQVRKVWELLVPTRGYVNCKEYKTFHWGVAQKPHEESGEHPMREVLRKARTSLVSGSEAVRSATRRVIERPRRG